MYDSEDEGRKDFYETHLPRVDATLSMESVLQDYADGVVRGSLIEFKLRINDLNATLLQAIKYLSRRRIRGKPVCATMVLVSLNDQRAYLFDSSDYLEQIETVYVGAASKANEGFVAGTPTRVLDYSRPAEDEALVQQLRILRWTKTHIDESCVVGWAEEYYRRRPGATKSDFIGDAEGKVKILGEIRCPSVFEDYLIPYEGRTNVRFNYLMDRLNDFLHKKDLGAFFTPRAYAVKAAELVRKAVARVPAGNDYIILDRCAGTGNLELVLDDETLSHVIVSTYEYYEYKVLVELIGDKVRHVVPPTERDDTFYGGMVRGSDALSEEFLCNEVIKGYVEDERVTVILLENPPFAEATSMEHQVRGAGASSSASWKSSHVYREMARAVRADPSVDGKALNDIGNAFIWSGFEYYLRQPTDSYVVFSPIKYWKAQGLVKRRLLGGFAGDRHHYHARKHSCVVVALWSQEPSDQRSFSIDGWDIDGKGELVKVGRLRFEKVESTFSAAYYDKRALPSDEVGGLTVRENGLPTQAQKVKVRPRRGASIIGYLVADSRNFEQPDLHSCLLVAAKYNGNGFYLRRDNFTEKLPMYAAGRYISYNGSWTERGRVMKSGDGKARYERDVRDGRLSHWLRQVLLFCCLEYQNHMRSLTGPDGHYYRNELCLDGTNGATAALDALEGAAWSNDEIALLRAWDGVMGEARRMPSYRPELTYGLYQIGEELNTYTKDAETGARVYDSPALNGAIKALKSLVKQYYLGSIVPTLFEYGFLK